jgi:hypothetical protein
MGRGVRDLLEGLLERELWWSARREGVVEVERHIDGHQTDRCSVSMKL